MYNNLKYNESVGEYVPYPTLTINPIFEGDRIMGNQRIPLHEIIGKKFSRWTALSEANPHVSPKGKKYRKIRCQCDCGEIGDVFLDSLRSGHSKSCGEKHGMSSCNKNERIYNVWGNMKSRCYRESNSFFGDYGGRGITVCDEWQEFIPFYKWAISHGYSDDKFIDRENVDGNYEPGNCRFVTLEISNHNTRLLRKNNTSGYRGVCVVDERYMARITINSKGKHLGVFTNPIDAANAYDTAAHELNDGRPLNFN